MENRRLERQGPSGAREGSSAFQTSGASSATLMRGHLTSHTLLIGSYLIGIFDGHLHWASGGCCRCGFRVSGVHFGVALGILVPFGAPLLCLSGVAFGCCALVFGREMAIFRAYGAVLALCTR